MSKAQFLTTPGGEELVILPRAEFERITALAGEAEEDAADVAAYDAAKAELQRSGEVPWPAELSALLLKRKSRLAAARKWRGLSQAELAAKIGVAQGFLSDIERKRRTGGAETIARLAAALDVPVSWLA